jgi:hypothetical protein
MGWYERFRKQQAARSQQATRDRAIEQGQANAQPGGPAPNPNAPVFVMTITMRADGHVALNGPPNKMICYGMLEMAREIVAGIHPPVEEPAKNENRVTIVGLDKVDEAAEAARTAAAALKQGAM